MLGYHLVFLPVICYYVGNPVNKYFYETFSRNCQYFVQIKVMWFFAWHGWKITRRGCWCRQKDFSLTMVENIWIYDHYTSSVWSLKVEGWITLQIVQDFYLNIEFLWDFYVNKRFPCEDIQDFLMVIHPS